MPSRYWSPKLGRVLSGFVVCVGFVGALSVTAVSPSAASVRPAPVSASPSARVAGLRAATSPGALARRMGRMVHAFHFRHVAAATTNLGPSPAHWLHAPASGTLTAGTRNGLESTNWSGMIATGITFTGVYGEWTVPTVAASVANQYSGTWVGIDGATNGSLIQTGTSQNSGGGITSYNAWFEILPSAEMIFPDPVSPGDAIQATVYFVSAGTWHIAIGDVTKGWVESANVSYNGPGATAEWIEEAPTVNKKQAALANFGTMQFGNIQITGSGSSAGLVPVAMEDSHGVVIAYPGTFNSTSGSFPITFGTPVPVIRSVSPAQGGSTGGTSVVISGDYLTGASSVKVGGTSVPSTVNPDNSLTVTSPAEPAGTVDVTVTTPGGPSVHSAADQFTYVLTAQAITFTSTSPSAATVGGPTYTVSATGGGSGNPVTLSIDPSASSVCSIAGSTVSFTGVGTCVIDANQLGNASYSAAPQAQQSFAVGPHTDAITSAAAASGKVGKPFTFTVTTAGVPVPSITKVGKLPKHLTLVNHGDGTATLAGIPTKAGTYHFSIKATFGTGKTKKVLTQPFTLTVSP